MFDLGRSFLAAVERRPEAVAISDGALKKTYEDWFADIQRAAHGLERLGLGKGDHLVTLHWACQFSGIVMTPLNWRCTADDLNWCLADADARALVHDDSCAEAVLTCGALQIPCISVGDSMVEGAMSFEQLCSEAPGEIILRAGPEDWSLMLYTSGTTSRPKGVPRRHRAERAAAVAHVAQNLYGHEECTLGVMPLYHTMGVRSLLSMALIDGHFVCVPKFDVEVTLDAIEREKI
ncbi:AMP-binding protein, partial [Stutzerimonas nitrititolerans]|uniref:AMP-binding protein n=1 Tax=Stutzerimonas nitrititolerans TaxID=2482751 RepID=UPI0028A80EB8